MARPTSPWFLVLMVAFTPRLCVGSYVVTTFVGSSNYGFADSPDPHYAVPQGVATGPDNSVYVADTYNNCIRHITADGKVTTIAGLPGNRYGDGPVETAGFFEPVGIVVDDANTIYVAEPQAEVIRKISHGAVTTLAGSPGLAGSADGASGAARFRSPNGLAIDSAGNLLVADSGNAAVRKIAPDGTVSTFAGVAGVTGSQDGAVGAATFEFPFGITVGSDGVIYVSDRGAGTVRKIAGGAVTTLAGLADHHAVYDANGTAARFDAPSGLAVDSLGYVYVADYGSNTVRRISPTGDVLTAGIPYMIGFRDGSYEEALFNHPGDIAVDRGGNLYLADLYNEAIRKLSPGGMITTFSGPAAPGNGDGLRAEAQLYLPQGLAYDAGGNLYVAETDRQVIRKVTPDGNVTTLAGEPFTPGNADGAGASARFDLPNGVAVDAAGNVFVADFGNDTIRKVTPAGVVVTIAGSPRQIGSTDGVGTAARFYYPSDLKFDPAGNLIVADSGNNTLRRITPDGTVTTIAGSAGNPGFVDGSGAAARFSKPWSLAFDSHGNLFVGDSGNAVIREMTPSGVVTTFAGVAGEPGFADGSRTTAQFREPRALAVDANGNVFVADDGNNSIREITPAGSVTTIIGDGLFGSADGLDDVVRLISPGGLVIDPAGSLVIADTYNNIIRHAGALLPSHPASAIINLSVRANLVADSRLITGFVLSGAAQPILIRGVGPGLDPYVGGTVTASDPRLELYDAVANLEQTNDNWGGAPALRDAFARVGAFPLPDDSRDAATLATITGQHSAHVLSPAGGLALVEAYNAGDSSLGRLINVSARYSVGSGAGALVAGFVISGSAPKTVLIRGIGPTLAGFGINDAIADPVLEVYDSNQRKIATNDNWAGALKSTFSSVGAFGLTAGSNDAAVLITLPPGAYSAQVTNAGAGVGEGMVEIYDVGN